MLVAPYPRVIKIRTEVIRGIDVVADVALLLYALQPLVAVVSVALAVDAPYMHFITIFLYVVLHIYVCDHS